MAKDKNIDRYKSSLQELLEYGAVIRDTYPELEREREEELSKRLPRRDAVKEKREDKPEVEESSAVPCVPEVHDIYNLHYRPYEQGIPVLTTIATEDAVNAIRELKELESAIPRYFVSYIDDDGNKVLKGTETFQDAKLLAETELEQYLADIRNETRGQIVYIDEGEGGPYKATPLEYIADDGSMRCEAEAQGKLHVYRGDEHYIVYNELEHKTARWDIFEFAFKEKFQKKHEPESEKNERKKTSQKKFFRQGIWRRRNP